MKKIIALTLCIIFSVCLPVHAELQVIGTTKVTDIVAFIDTHGIPCYNYNGYTFISAENLQYYGFDVNWNGDTQTLTMDYNPTKQVTAEHGIPYELDLHYGANMHKVYASDNKVIMNGYPIEAYSIDGQMIINFENLSCLGEVIWNSGLRTIYVTTDRFRAANRDWQDTLPAYIAAENSTILGAAVAYKSSVLLSNVSNLLSEESQRYSVNMKRSMASCVNSGIYAEVSNMKNSLQNRCNILEQMPHFYLKNEILRTNKEILVECNAYLIYADCLKSSNLENLLKNYTLFEGSSYLETFCMDLLNKAKQYIQLDY
uniref:Copper amine oxidase-like N-terminal domain-containing protein n=1 Tax=uncultured Bacillota bacterium TaxID=344338 RepID=A0A650EPV4_9FIRM|nr:hypothetical protein Firmicute1046_0400 [uncultured Firmicutes bacterium]